MEAIITRIKTTVDSGVSLDIEILLDDLVEATKQINDTHKEDLHNQGRQNQQFYDSIINQLIEMISSEIVYLKQQPATEQSQHFYKTFKIILNILNDIPTVF